MKSALTIFTLVAVSVLAGCGGPVREKELFTVNFQKGQTLRYKFASSRNVEINWGQVKGGSKRGKDKVDKSRESMDMVVAYTPIEVGPYGAFTTIKATCESVKIRRSKGPKQDAVKSLAGKSFTFTVDATGKIEDYSQLDELIKETGKKAFQTGTKKRRIKDPDMIADFISSQWFLWDSIRSIEKPKEGVLVDQSWKSQLSVPTPMVTRKARDVTYTRDGKRTARCDKEFLFTFQIGAAKLAKTLCRVFQNEGYVRLPERLQNSGFARPGRGTFQHRHRSNRAT